MSNETTPAEAFAAIINSKLYRVSTNVVAVVTAWHPEDNTVDVQPVNQRLMAGEEEYANMPIVTGVPVQFYGAGDVWVTFEPEVDSYCLLSINERSLDVWKLSGGVVAPNAARHHDMADAVAYFGLNPSPDAIKTITPGMALRTRDGTVSATVSADGVIAKVGTTTIDVSQSEIVMTVGAATFKIEASGITSSVPITAPDFQNVAGTKFTTHIHSGSPTAPVGPISPTLLPVPGV